MKKLSPNNVKIAEFTRLSSYYSPRQLFRVNIHQYVILLLDRGTQTFAFESTVFSELLADLRDSIEDVTVLAHMEPERCENSHASGYEIRLHLAEGGIASIDNVDKVCLIPPADDGEQDNCNPGHPVADIWNELPDVFPYSHLQITKELVELLHPFVGNSSPNETLNQLWADYQKVSTSSNHGKRLSIEGEFIAFNAKSFANGLTIFDCA